MRRVLGTVAGVVLSLTLVAPAVAAPPELFVREQRWDTHEETGPWLPLASAPALDYLGGYEIGYRRQMTGFRARRADDRRRARRRADPADERRRRSASAACPGEIVAAGAELQFEGSGTYTVKVSVGRPATA